MSSYKYAMGGETGGPVEEKVEKMKSDILSALEGGASDKEIMMMVQDSGLQDKYEFNWDNVEMKVEAYPIEGGSEGEAESAGVGSGIEALLSKLKNARGAAKDDRFGPSDAPGQRGDMFGDGGNTQFDEGDHTDGRSADQRIKEYESILNRTGVSEEARQKYSDLIKKIRASEKMDNGGNTGPGYPVAGQETSVILQDDDGEFYVYDLEKVRASEVRFDASKEDLDAAAKKHGLEKLYVPKYNDGKPKLSREGDWDKFHPTMLSDDTFEVIEIGSRKVLMPYTEVDPAYRRNTDRQSPDTPGYNNISEEQAKKAAEYQGSRGRGMNNPPKNNYGGRTFSYR